MNLIILEAHHFLSTDIVRLQGRHFEHVKQVLKSKVGDLLNVGHLDGFIGKALITRIATDSLELSVLDLAPPPPTLPVTIVLGLPRPRMLQRTLQTIATMGVERLQLIHTHRVEKSFWHTPLLKPECIHEQLVLGLEQGKATQLPKIELYPNFNAFIDTLSSNTEASCRKLIAHPGNFGSAEPGDERTLLAVGPEGGFVEHELSAFIEQGFSVIQLGERILRVETAIPVLLAKLFH
jgi:16S rRNA (uracil1498-N3)-methyltransferase